MIEHQLFIDGEFVDAASGETFESIEPATGQPWARLAKADASDARRAVEAARRAFDEGPWPRMSGPERAARLRRVAELLGERMSDVAEAEARDGGGTIRKAQLADVGVSIASFQWFADCAENQPDVKELEGSPFPPSENEQRYEPYGVTTGITPWNFPLVMASWKIAPSIAAGNCCVLKPATYTSVTAVMLAELCAEAGIPPGVVNVVTGPGGVLGEELVTNPMVDKTAFTGSTEVGQQIMQMAATNITDVTLELGGKSANVVLADADLDTAVAGVLFGTFFHGGQVCQSGTRALVAREVYDEFVSMLVDRAGKITLGDPLDMGTDLGPLIGYSQVKTTEEYVASGRDEVGEPLCGGRKPETLPEGLDRDAFYEPTVFADVPNDSRIAREEIFGPVLSVIPFEGDDDAVRIANDSVYGLAGGVWSSDLARARKVAEGMRTGTVWINDFHMLDPRRPFGGYKQSGIGRELGVEGYRAYQQVKHLYTNPQSGRGAISHFGILSGNI